MDTGSLSKEFQDVYRRVTIINFVDYDKIVSWFFSRVYLQKELLGVNF